MMTALVASGKAALNIFEITPSPLTSTMRLLKVMPVTSKLGSEIARVSLTSTSDRRAGARSRAAPSSVDTGRPLDRTFESCTKLVIAYSYARTMNSMRESSGPRK
jgi:hypothetical protein